MTASDGDGYFKTPKQPKRSLYCPREWRADHLVWWREHCQFLSREINLLPAIARERRIEMHRVHVGLVEDGVEGRLSMADEEDLGAHGCRARGAEPFCHRPHFGCRERAARYRPESIRAFPNALPGLQERNRTKGFRMFYEPHLGHGLPHDPFKAIIAPRPIGWISSLDQQGRPNLAPYSFFNAVHSSPPMLAFTSESMKHSAANAIATGEFVFNLCTRPLFDAMNISSDTLPEGVSEFEAAGLATAPCRVVKAPRVAAAPAALECKVTHSMQLQDINGAPLKGWIIIGQVVGVHIDEAYITDGRFDTAKAQPLARCGYRDYAAVTEMFEALRPTDGGGYAPGQKDR